MKQSTSRLSELSATRFHTAVSTHRTKAAVRDSRVNSGSWTWLKAQNQVVHRAVFVVTCQWRSHAVAGSSRYGSHPSSAKTECPSGVGRIDMRRTEGADGYSS